MKILISEEHLNGTLSNQFEIELENEITTVAELIQKRIAIEVDNYNRKQSAYYNGLVKPTEAEETLNGYKMKKGKFIDIEKQVYVALDAFQKNGFFMLIDDKQIDDLHTEIIISGTSKVSFIKLTPLVGG